MPVVHPPRSLTIIALSVALALTGCAGADKPARFRHDLFSDAYEVARDDRRFGAV